MSTMILGITGGIGSGKSYISALLRQRGIPVYDCDTEAKRIINTNEYVRAKLTALLGSQLYRADGLDKRLLADFLFASERHTATVNAIVHPAVKDDFQQWATCRQQNGAPLVALESAILYESGFADTVDKVLLVYAPESLRLQRTIARDHTTETQVRQRMARQMDEEEKCCHADFIIYNDGSQPLEVQIDTMLDTFSHL